MSVKILILDFGSQTTHLIARRIENFGISTKIISGDSSIQEIQSENPQALILSGGPSSVYAKNALLPDKKIFSLNLPTLGICYGLQITTHLLGGTVIKGTQGEYGPSKITLDKKSPLFKNIPKNSSVWMSHFDSVSKIPPGFKLIASTPAIKFAAIENGLIYCVQFHPEVQHTEYGKEILRNFLINICKFPISPTRLSWEKITTSKKIKEIKEAVENEKAILAFSGGVDSSVTAALVSQAIGKNLYCLYVDTGLMRLGETQIIKKTFSKTKFNLKVINAQKIFLKNLRGIISPEQKRKIIGHTFIKVLEKEARKIKGVKFLVQGTIYPDVIESQGTAHSHKIKTHHNVGGLPKKLNLKLIEPLRDLYKDQVRDLGTHLGLPYEIIHRQAFPGPGLAVRMIGEVTLPKLSILKKADFIVQEEIKKTGLYYDLWMSFAIFTGVKTTGVVGDERTYGETIAVRAITSIDTMTTDWARLPYDLLARISTRITNEVRGVCRVVYDITTKPPATMEWE